MRPHSIGARCTARCGRPGGLYHLYHLYHTPPMTWPPVTMRVDLGGRWMIHADHGSRPDDRPGPLPIDLPCAWQTVLGAEFHGRARIERRVTIPRELRAGDPGRRLWLRFESVATEVTARVDGVEVGRHTGDWVPFQFEITGDAGSAREIDVALLVDEIRADPPAQAGALQNGHITKGFHDVISLQHGGVWQPLHLSATGDLCAIPDGVAVRADPRTGEVRVCVELEPGHRPDPAPGVLEATVLAPDGSVACRGRGPIDRAASTAELALRVEAPRLWSPDAPALYVARVALLEERPGGAVPSEEHAVRFGFRTLRAEGRTIFLNERPVFLRGVLDWGHEPEAIAPAPARGEVEARFRGLRAMGFNAVCLCMWYAPRHLYDVADETGMLVWQEHPVWQSPMRPADLQEYRRLYRAFLRRDRNHPCIAVASATCEHPAFDRDLAAFWWEAARRELPGALLELQTAFFKWADPERTDLHDEHTYENSDRWPAYLEDVQAHLATLPPRPFVMGETIAFSSWPDVPALRGRLGAGRAWWAPRALDRMAELEHEWAKRYGAETVARFRRQGDRHHLLGRKFQVEQFRRFEGDAGLVMNHLRDVPSCQCGFMDDLGRVRFEPSECRGWLDDAALLLWTPEHRRGFAGGGEIPCRLALSNFSHRRFRGEAEVLLNGEAVAWVRLRCEPGEIASAPVAFRLPDVEAPTCLGVTAHAAGIVPNSWDLWVFPPLPPWPRGAARFSGLPFTAAESEPDEVERGYSRGWGLPARSWHGVLPDPAAIAPELHAWADGPAPPGDLRVLLTHRLTGPIVEWLESGGRVVLLASRGAGGPFTSYEWLFGQVPLVIERGPLRPGDSEWLVDLHDYDLSLRHGRVLPVERLGIADRADPLVRLVYTHDQGKGVRLFDRLFAARVGRGLLVVTSLDHTGDAGRWLLRRIVAHAADPRTDAEGALEASLVRSWAVARAEAAARV